MANGVQVHWFKTLSQPQHQGKLQRLLFKPKRSRNNQHHLILLDTSASCLKGQGIQQAKGAILGLAEQCYLARQQITLMTFGNNQYQVHIHNIRAPKDLLPLLDSIKAGGGTPMAQALDQAGELLSRQQKRTPLQQQNLYLFTDGRNDERLALTFPPINSWVIDMESGPVRLGKCKQIAKSLNAQYLYLNQLALQEP